MADLYDQVQRIEEDVAETKRRLDNQERGLGKKFLESIRERIDAIKGQSTAGVTESNIDTTVTDSNGDTVDVLDYPDGFLQVEFDGATYNLPYYNNI